MFASLICWALNCAAINQTEIKLYTYTDPPNFTAQYHLHTNLTSITLDPTKPVRFLTHGWRQNYQAHWIEPAISAFYKQDEISNVVVIDWSRYSGTIWYPHASRDTEPVGQIVGRLVLRLCKRLGVPLWNVHLIGASLGAHMFGFAGKFIHSKTGQNVGRITGLDPASLYFENASPANRLFKTDANFVDVIHTDINFLGYKEALGHIDYFPNGGYSQPGCSFILFDIYCNHRRAALYYVESIKSVRLKAWKCANYTMYERSEDNCDNNTQIILGHSQGLYYDGDGTYFLRTNEKAPYGCNC